MPPRSGDSVRVEAATDISGRAKRNRIPDVSGMRSCVRLGRLAQLRAVDGEGLDGADLLGRERRSVAGLKAVFQLADARCADERRGDLRVAQNPGQRHLRESLAAALRDLVE